MVVQERYSPIPIGANTTVEISGNAIGLFVCTTSGTLTVVSNAYDGKATTTIVTALAVTAGQVYPLPFFLGSNGGSVTTAGGAVGTIGV